MQRPLCTRQGCQEPAQWQPVLWVPIRSAAETLVKIVLPVQVCSVHKIPKQGWPGLSDPGIVETIQHKHGEALLDRAWITHEYIGPALDA